MKAKPKPSIWKHYSESKTTSFYSTQSICKILRLTNVMSITKINLHKNFTWHKPKIGISNTRKITKGTQFPKDYHAIEKPNFIINIYIQKKKCKRKLGKFQRNTISKGKPSLSILIQHNNPTWSKWRKQNKHATIG